ncbi:MAG: glycosyltransferase [Bacteroidota bacterium]
MIQFFYWLISGTLLFFLVFPFGKVLLSRFFTEQIDDTKVTEDFDFGCIITAYKNVKITEHLVRSLLKQSHQKFHIYLVADACDPAEFSLEDERLTILYPNPPLKLKAKSIIHAMDSYVRLHDYTAVFDADNLAHPNFLTAINRYANQGYRSIQGQRTAKNLDSIYACADATGEFYKNFVERYVPYLIGSSSVISGSGMAVETNLYRAYLNSPDIQAGKEKWKKMLQEDKILQNFLLRRNETIVFAKNAIVYDEKVTTADQVETQRSRWLYSYFQNLPNSLGLIRRGLFNFSWNQLIFGLITIAPPLFILLFSSIFCLILGLFIDPTMSIYLFMSLGIFVVNIFWSLYLSEVPDRIWNALWGIPLFIFKQFTALFKMSNPNKNFKHSEHTKAVKIEELLGK